MQKQKGFSLIELLIVVAIILIIAAIAIPNLLRARIAANESSAVASIRTINTAEVTFSTSHPTVGYSSTLAALGGAAPCVPSATQACLIDNTLAGGTKSGYTFQATGIAIGGINTGVVVSAVPLNWNQSGVRGFCSNEDAVIRATPGTTAPAAVATTAACNAYTVLQ